MIRSTFDALMTRSTLRALRHRNYAIVEGAGWFSAAGVWFYRIGIQVLTWEMTHSGTWLGIIALAEALPTIFLMPFAGILADRHDRLVMGRIVQFAIMLVTAVLAVVVLGGWIEMWSLLLFALAHGAANAFWMPVRMAIVPNLVPREDLSAAIALHATLFNLARFMGPALVAPILAIWGAGAAFAVNALTYLVYLVALYTIKLTNPDARAQPGRSLAAHLREGLEYVRHHPALKYIFLSLVVTAVFMRAYMELLPGLSDEVFGYDPKKGVAILVSAAGLGAIGGSLIIGNITRTATLLRGYFIGLFAAVSFLALFAATNFFWFAVGSAALLSGAQMAITVSGQVMVQSTVSGELRGRVMSIWGLISRGGPALGATLLGWLAGFFGFQWPILGAAAVTGIVAVYIFTKRQTMRTVLVADEEDRAMANAARRAAE